MASRSISWLQRLGIPSDEIRPRGLRHARAARLLSGKDATIQFDADPLQKRWLKKSGLEELDGVMLETVSAHRRDGVLVVRNALGVPRARDQILSCEPSSPVSSVTRCTTRASGWYYFAWRAPQWTRARATAGRPTGPVRAGPQIERRFWRGRDAPAFQSQGCARAGRARVRRATRSDTDCGHGGRDRPRARRAGPRNVARMAHSTAGKLNFFAGVLKAPLGAAQRRTVLADVNALLRWQKDFVAWTKPRTHVDASPFVALYAHGTLLGCFGASEGSPGDRLARAFLRAMNDMRFGGVGDAHRDALVAEVSYVIDARPLDPDQLEGVFEPGTHGLGVVREQGGPRRPLAGRRSGSWLPCARDVGRARPQGRRSRTIPSAQHFFSFETEGTRRGASGHASALASVRVERRAPGSARVSSRMTARCSSRSMREPAVTLTLRVRCTTRVPRS